MRIPAIKISPALAFDRQTFAADVRDVNFREELLNLGVKADRFLQRHGVPSEDFIFHRERLTINLFPKNFQPPGDVFGHNYFYAGRCPAEQRHYGEWRNERAEERPTALVATSSSYLRGADYFKMCMEAFDGLQWHVLLSIGDNADPNLLGPLPPHFEIVKNIAQVKILPYVNLAIFPGGLITSSEAAYHGVPLIAVTMGHSELEWLGDNIERLGIGIHLRKPNTSAMTIRKAVIDISRDHVFLKRVKEMQHKVRREFGAEEAVNRIEEMLEEG
jgi:MGT family glycosyltransferase